jgi:hypothetical protein
MKRTYDCSIHCQATIGATQGKLRSNPIAALTEPRKFLFSQLQVVSLIELTGLTGVAGSFRHKSGHFCPGRTPSAETGKNRGYAAFALHVSFLPGKIRRVHLAE